MNQNILTVGLVGFLTLGVVDSAGGEGPAQQLDPPLQHACGLRVAKVIRGRLNSEITLDATVAADDRDVALVRAGASGVLERLRLSEPQRTVRQGEPLADLYVPDWFAPQVAYLAVRGLECPGAAHLAESAGRRLSDLGMPEELIRALETTGRPQTRRTVTAPVSGIVSDLAARKGMRVSLDSLLFRINALSTVWANAEVPDRIAREFGPGEAVTARTAALPDAVFSGRIATILPSASAANRAAIASVVLANPHMQLLPGMSVTLRFGAVAGADVLLVPSEAILGIGAHRVVTVFEKDGQFRPVRVEIGSQSAGQTEIRSGLTVGQKVLLFDI
jgi:Cu(I)/Ag(I) efflux system membrane fusion protein